LKGVSEDDYVAIVLSHFKDSGSNYKFQKKSNSIGDRNMKHLQGKNAIISGGSRGLGLEIARKLAKEGVNVAINARDKNLLQKAAKELVALGVKAIYVVGDITSESVRTELVARTLKELGSIDILVNNAGREPMTSFEAQDKDDIVNVIALNLTSGLLLTHQALPHMLKKKMGQIVVISSGLGKKGQPYAAAYAATKGGQVRWAESLRAELEDKGIGVTVICPSMIRGAGVVKEFVDDTGLKPPMMATVTTEQCARAVLKSIKKNPPEIIVSPAAWSLRIVLAFENLCPGKADTILKAMGVYGYMRKLGEWSMARK
jgi:short-subunit dehydrogenase